MRTRKFKTLSGLCRALYGNELTYSEFISGRAVMKNAKGYAEWCPFTLEAKARREYAEGIAKVLWAKPDEDKIRAVLRYYGRSYGIFQRLWYSHRYKRYEYCAGQDYTGEIRTLRKLIL